MANCHNLAPKDALVKHVHAVHDDGLERVFSSNYGGDKIKYSAGDRYC